MSKNIHLKPTIPRGIEGQYLDFLRNEDYSEIAWIGGFQAGKTDGLVTSIIDTAFQYPGCRMALCRDELTNLKRTTLVDLLEKMPELIEDHNKTESIITFPAVPDHEGVPRQSVLYCFGLMTGDYVQKLKSLQPFRIFLDEADKLLEEQIDICVLRCRQKVYHRETGKEGKNQVKSVANDEGANWYWRRYVGKEHPGQDMTPEWRDKNVGIRESFFTPDAADDIYEDDIIVAGGKRYLVTHVEDDRVHVKGSDKTFHWNRCRVVMQKYCLYTFTKENKSASQQSLKASRGVSKALRDKYILGKVDIKSGLVFPEFDPNVNIIPEQEIPGDWRVVAGIDHGYDHPTACVWLALDSRGDLIAFEEYMVSGRSSMENGEEISWLTGDRRKIIFFGDTQMWNVDPRHPGQTIANDYMRAGVKPLRKANKVREISVERIKDWLRPEQTLYRPDPTPRLRIMENCTNLIRQMSSIKWEDFNAGRNDDMIDALRYGVMGVYDAKRNRRSPDDIQPQTYGFGAA